MRTLGMLLIESFVSDKQMKDEIYKILKPYFNKKFRDSNWKGVYQLIDELKKNGFTVVADVKYGGYRSNDDTEWKEYELEISKDMRTLHAILTCSPCGPIKDPFSVYDLSLTF